MDALLTLYLFISDWVHTVGLVAIYLTLTFACLALCLCCVWKSCRRILQYRFPNLPVAECNWFVNQEEARMARELLNNAGFTPVTMRCKRIRPKRKVNVNVLITLLLYIPFNIYFKILKNSPFLGLKCRGVHWRRSKVELYILRCYILRFLDSPSRSRSLFVSSNG